MLSKSIVWLSPQKNKICAQNRVCAQNKICAQNEAVVQISIVKVPIEMWCSKTYYFVYLDSLICRVAMPLYVCFISLLLLQSCSFVGGASAVCKNHVTPYL